MGEWMQKGDRVKDDAGVVWEKACSCFAETTTQRATGLECPICRRPFINYGRMPTT